MTKTLVYEKCERLPYRQPSTNLSGWTLGADVEVEETRRHRCLLEVSLFEADTLRASWTRDALHAPQGGLEIFALTTSQVASITDWADLEVRVRAYQVRR